MPPVWNNGNSGYTVYAQGQIAPFVDRLRPANATEVCPVNALTRSGVLMRSAAALAAEHNVVPTRHPDGELTFGWTEQVTGPFHGFNELVPLAAGSYTVCGDVLRWGGAVAASMGCQQFIIAS